MPITQAPDSGDITAFLNAAFATAGTTVQLQNCDEYTISAPIVVSSGSVLCGAGRSATKLLMSNNPGPIVQRTGAGSYSRQGLEIVDLSMDGGNIATPIVVTNPLGDINDPTTFLNDVHFERVDFYHMGQPLRLEWTLGASLVSCKMQDCAQGLATLNSGMLSLRGWKAIGVTGTAYSFVGNPALNHPSEGVTLVDVMSNVCGIGMVANGISWLQGSGLSLTTCANGPAFYGLGIQNASLHGQFQANPNNQAILLDANCLRVGIAPRSLLALSFAGIQASGQNISLLGVDMVGNANDAIWYQVVNGQIAHCNLLSTGQTSIACFPGSGNKFADNTQAMPTTGSGYTEENVQIV